MSKKETKSYRDTLNLPKTGFSMKANLVQREPQMRKKWAKENIYGQIKIRKAVVEDVPAIVELWKELMDFHKELDGFFGRSAAGHERFAEFLTSNIEKEDSCVLVAADGENVVGYCQACISQYPPVLIKEKYVQIFDMGVTKKYQRQGIGRMIIDALRRWYSDKDVDRIELKYLTTNKSAEEFWTKMGFKPYLKTAFLEM